MVHHRRAHQILPVVRLYGVLPDIFRIPGTLELAEANWEFTPDAEV